MARLSPHVPSSRGRTVTALLTAAVAGAACGGESPLAARRGYEIGDAACSDAFDDDADGLVDCADPDCLTTSGRCGPVVPLVPTDPVVEGPWRPAPGAAVLRSWLLAVCTDRIDNDGDGRFDCGDPGCSEVPELCCGREADDRACADGADNDADGFVDCDDHGCAATALCARPRPPIAIDACLEADACATEDTLERCRDGHDNDGDGFVDCNDFDCSRSAAADILEHCATAEERNPEACDDGLDNDGDGFVDCEDYSCARVEDGAPEAVAAACAVGRESTVAACTNGVDDDGDGFVDCDDRSCRRPDDPLLGPICSESAPERVGQWVLMPDERCADGLDNDRDGFTDCADWDCSFDERVTVCPGRPPDRCSAEDLDPPPSCARADGQRVCP